MSLIACSKYCELNIEKEIGGLSPFPYFSRFVKGRNYDGFDEIQ
jgi:hypothetical protein